MSNGKFKINCKYCLKKKKIWGAVVKFLKNQKLGNELNMLNIFLKN